MHDLISRQMVIDALHTWFRDGFDEDKWWNSTHVLAAIEGLPPVQQEHRWETCFECPLSHGCSKIKGCTNEQAIEYASQIPNDCPLSAQPEIKTDGDTISRQAAIDALEREKTYCTAFRDGYTPINVFEKYNAGLTDGIKALKNLPSVQLERKVGHWVPIDDEPHEDYECDVCGFISEAVFCPGGRGNFYNYCPNCGARMKI